MKTVARSLWTEPAAFIALIVGVLTVAQTLIVDDRTVSAAIAAALIALGGYSTRARVSPAPGHGEA
jgi:hypothetical protein